MAADPASVQAQLAVLQRTLRDPTTGLPLYAYDNPPYSLTTGTMPLFVNYVGALQSVQEMGRDSKGVDNDETWQYKMDLYIAPYGSGIEGENYGVCTPYFDLVLALFGANPHLQQLGGVRSAKIVSATGAGTIPWADQDYYGIRFILQVIARTRRTFAAGE